MDDLDIWFGNISDNDFTSREEGTIISFKQVYKYESVRCSGSNLNACGNSHRCIPDGCGSGYCLNKDLEYLHAYNACYPDIPAPPTACEEYNSENPNHPIHNY